MRSALTLLPGVRFISLRRRLFASFLGVLLLSLVLTAAIFWFQIRIYDTQQVQSDLGTSAPAVLIRVKELLYGYWQTNGAASELREGLEARAHQAGVRIVLTDYCNHVAVDTNYTGALVQLPPSEVLPTCSASLADPGAARGQPQTLFLEPGSEQVRQTNGLPGGGTWFYRAYQAPSFGFELSPGQQAPLSVRTIILAKSPAGVEQNALSTILPRLAAAGIFAVLLTLVVVVLIVGAITRPLRMITAASERMARGDYDQRVPEAREDEVGQLARSFNRMASEVSNAREMQRQFIANVSHDLKTPLTSILGFSHILAERAEEQADPTQQRAAQVINEEARRLQRLTLDLLDLSRLEAGQLQLKHDMLDLNELAGKAFARYAELPANAHVHFLDERVPGALPIWGDADRLMQVLVNLLDNAVKFCDPAGSVALRTKRQGKEATLTVANTGAGIAPEDLIRVFQRFYRADQSRARRTGGAGLGLAIVREIVAAHSGRVEAHSDIGGWTRFVVTLPIAASARAGGAGSPQPQAGEKPQAPASVPVP